MPDLPDPGTAPAAPPTPEGAALRGDAPRFPFDNSYARLPERFFARLDPTPVAAPRLLRLNDGLARELGLDPDALRSPAGVAVLVGNRVPGGAEPIAQAYAGHQFGGFVPQLGDGRAILLGEVVGRDGRRRDVQLKGAGPTPFSRRGDGRAAMGPVLREYLVSEAMHALGIPATRALAAVATGEAVLREEPLPGAVLTRIAASHIRVGTFQFFAARRDLEALRLLADHCIARHDPDAAGAAHPHRALLEGVVRRQAELVARWLLVGFVHGVMNTDNTAISGETIDFGPCAFLDAYDPATVFSSIDQLGRYAYAAQPRVAHWNLARLAEAMLPLLDPDEDRAVGIAEEALAGFGPAFEAAWLGGLRRKLGLATEREGDGPLARDLMERMAANGADFTLTFWRLCDAAAGPEGGPAAEPRNGSLAEPRNDAPATRSDAGAGMVPEGAAGPRSLFADPAAFDAWAVAWRRRLAEEPGDPAARRAAMRAANPARIPRNHLVEAALDAAVRRDDLAPFEALLEAVSHPYEERPDLAGHDAPPGPEQGHYRTFCGT